MRMENGDLRIRIDVIFKLKLDPRVVAVVVVIVMVL